MDNNYARVEMYMFKAGNGKSVTIPISREQFEIEQVDGKLILNVSIVGLQGFLSDENWKRFGLNKIKGGK